MVRIAPSILAADFLHLERDVRLVNDHADLLHFDVMDGCLVPNLSFGFPVLEAVAKVAAIPLDVHLMIVNPDKYIERFAKAGASLISFHLEAADEAGKDAGEYIALARSCGVKAGLAIDPDVPVERLFPFIPDVDFFLVMSVFAGFGGQKFMPSALDKVEYLKRKRQERGLDFLIEIDGGINGETGILAKEAGCDVLVAGSYLFKHPDGLIKGVKTLL